METKLDDKNRDDARQTETTLDKQRRSKMETKLDEINRDDARQKTLSRVLNLTQQFHYSTKKEGIGNLYTDT